MSNDGDKPGNRATVILGKDQQFDKATKILAPDPGPVPGPNPGRHAMTAPLAGVPGAVPNHDPLKGFARTGIMDGQGSTHQAGPFGAVPPPGAPPNFGAPPNAGTPSAAPLNTPLPNAGTPMDQPTVLDGHARPPVPGETSAKPGHTATRIIMPGFDPSEDPAATPSSDTDPQQAGGGTGTKLEESDTMETSSDAIVGWLVVVSGPGRGSYRSIYYGNNSIGRDPSQRICLNFGDSTISSQKQAFIRYDHEDRSFVLIPNLEKTNIISHNGDKPMAPVVLNALDEIGMGQTKLRFVPFCGPEFDWSDPEAK